MGEPAGAAGSGAATAPAGARARIRTALAHREPDRVPFDLGASRSSGIHVTAYRSLRSALGLPAVEPELPDFNQQLARVDRDMLDHLGIDAMGVFPRTGSAYERVITDDGEYLSFRDEFGIGRRMPKDGGLYFDAWAHPLAGDIDESDVDRFPWPDAGDPARYEGMAEEARRIVEQAGRAVYVVPICTGLTEVYFRLRGFEDGYMDLVANPGLASRIMDRILAIKLAYWEHVLAELGDWIDVAGESEDLGGQHGPLFSPDVYRRLVKPRQAELFGLIHARSRAAVSLHSCGSIRELIPDLIEVGVDVLNPVQVSAAGMDTVELKREFGADLTFWGGGVDTQRVLASGAPAEVRDEVRRRIDDLKPGGGFVFAAVHNVQADVPAANLLAMWEALREYGTYGDA
jgi:uroporphyrinogen decarboxylase